MQRVGVITGLKSEARLAQAAAREAGADVLVRCEGPGPVQARIAAKALAADGAGLLVSFGLAGALVPGLTTGTICLPKEVLTDLAAFGVEEGLHARALAALRDGAPRDGAPQDGSVRIEPLLGSSHIIATPEEKSKLAASFGAVAVDMESGGIAEVARDLGLSWLGLRAIADPAERAIPVEAQAGLGGDGGVNAFAVLAELARRPAVVPELVQLARDTAAANAALSRAARLLFLGLFVGGR